jgi:hypothetical protein
MRLAVAALELVTTRSHASFERLGREPRRDAIATVFGRSEG